MKQSCFYQQDYACFPFHGLPCVGSYSPSSPSVSVYKLKVWFTRPWLHCVYTILGLSSWINESSSTIRQLFAWLICSQYEIVRKSWNNLPFICDNINSRVVVKDDNIKYWAWGGGTERGSLHSHWSSLDNRPGGIWAPLNVCISVIYWASLSALLFLQLLFPKQKTGQGLRDG